MSASVSENRIIIENTYIKKELHTEKKRIKSFTIENKLSERILTVGKGSEEFVISFLGKSRFSREIIYASGLKISDVKTESRNSKTVVRIEFEAFRIKDSKILLSEVYELGDNEAFIRKHLELAFEKKGKRSLRLDYIGFEKFSFDGTLVNWSIPQQKNSHVPGYVLELGQPVYVDSLYFGCEFPLCSNKIKKGVATVTYYNGKSLSSLIKEDGYRSYDAVVGAAEGNLFAQVQKAFYGYIRTISKPCYLRRQYNSWYDNMLNITRENITASFLEIEKGLTGYGEPAMDSYVADDGWNDYGKGFWSFNSNFPDGLTPFTQLSESFGSRFGLWLGPRGGYTSDTPRFAMHIEQEGNGYYNKQARDICVASEKYAEKTGQLLLDFMKQYRLNYFKLDGFAQYACKNKKHDHMVGGKNNMYFYTDIWEKWIAVFERLNDSAAEKFWINLTCYAPPSAWFLRWVNSVWMQISNDHGFIGKKGKVSDKDGLLSYRDEMYFDFYESRQFQFPQMSLYNHDPIYGASAKVKMSDDEFREYLFTMAARGTCFWELYYSHSLMNEAKWRINHSALRFIDRNMSVLSHSVVFGGRPSEKSCYGYACFTDSEGILCLRNSSDEKQSFTVKLDENIGISKAFGKKEVCTVIPYTVGRLAEGYGYGDSFTAQLDGFETKIFHFGKKPETPAPVYTHPEGADTLEVSFDTLVGITDISCTENPLVKAELLEDFMTVRLTFENAFSGENSLTLSGVTDIAGNSTDIKLCFDYNENGVAVYRLKGNSGFSIKATLDGNANQLLMTQGDEIRLSLDEDGYALFTVGGETLRSLRPAGDTVQIVAVRERNGVMKLYFDGVPESGRPSENIYLKGDIMNHVDKVKVYDRAFSYDEV